MLSTHLLKLGFEGDLRKAVISDAPHASDSLRRTVIKGGVTSRTFADQL